MKKSNKTDTYNQAKGICTEDNIYSEYFKLTDEYQQKYGKFTIVLMQVGSFLEVYGVKTSDGGILYSQIQHFSEICQLNIAEKKSAFGNKGQIVMAGFMVYLLEKYLPRIIDGGYTAVVYLQEKEPHKGGKSYNRVLYKIFSPGTFISCDTDSSPQITNNIMCIWIQKVKPLGLITETKTKDVMICGISVVNIFTGKSYLFEYQTPFIVNNTAFDELERAVSVFQPSEVLLLSSFDINDIKKVLQYSGISSPSIHYYDTRNLLDTRIMNCENQQYIKHILSIFYDETVYDVCYEFHNNITATQSFCFLLNFIQEHNSDLIRKIALPVFNNTSDRLILANHTLMQLNIIDDSNKNSTGQYSSVLGFLNKCCTAIGKRRFQYHLTNPTFNTEWLNTEYEMIGKMLEEENYNNIDKLRKMLNQVRDIEKIIRQIILKKIYPSSISHLYKSIDIIHQINELYSSQDMSFYLCGEENSYSFMKEICNNILEFFNNTFLIDNCKRISSMTNFDENIFKTGISEELDKIILENEKNIFIFHQIREILNKLMQKNENSYDTDFIRIHETEKSGNNLQITSKRSQILKAILEKIPEKIDIDGIIIDFKDFKFSKAGSSSINMDIEHPVLNSICKKMLHAKENINQIISDTFLKVLNEIERTWVEVLEKLSKYVGKIDVLQSKAYIARKYKYCSPQISLSDDNDKSFVSAYDLRHCLIEHLQQNEIYVTNNISLGCNGEQGILLYGTNAVGKTSLIRALGIAVILAQSGMYVPCSRFIYKPYTAIFSRILGNDNIFKGLSTFAVEISELRVLLKLSDENSLILGDELCSGTETESALSIFVAGLMKLSSKNASFIFATHFHEIIGYEEIKSLKNVVMKHMAVRYDRENDCLIYDRLLRDGSGPRTYGLEVCKSLYLEEDFLDTAYSIRNKYYPECRGELSNKSTVYNSKKIRGICEICNSEIGEEIHHLSPQCEADDDGYIGTFHKNHTANLVSICENCHTKMHSSKLEDGKIINEKKVKKKTTKGYKIISIANE